MVARLPAIRRQFAATPLSARLPRDLRRSSTSLLHTTMSVLPFSNEELLAVEPMVSHVATQAEPELRASIQKTLNWGLRRDYPSFSSFFCQSLRPSEAF
jgi:hypothetical protein